MTHIPEPSQPRADTAPDALLKAVNEACGIIEGED